MSVFTRNKHERTSRLRDESFVRSAITWFTFPETGRGRDAGHPWRAARLGDVDGLACPRARNWPDWNWRGPDHESMIVRTVDLPPIPYRDTLSIGQVLY